MPRSKARARRGQLVGAVLVGPVPKVSRFRRKKGRVWLRWTSTYGPQEEHTEVVELRPGDSITSRFRLGHADGSGGVDYEPWTHVEFTLLKENPEG